MALTPEARDLLIRTIIGEAGGEGPEGWAAVAHVIKNRADSKAWGDPFAGGLTKTLTAPKQFSVWNAGDRAGNLARNSDPNSPIYQRIGQMADAIFDGQIADSTGGATHYYAPAGMEGGQAPSWAAQGQNVRRIGSQIFMTLPLNAGSTAGTVDLHAPPPGPAAQTGYLQDGDYPGAYAPNVNVSGFNPAFRAALIDLQKRAEAAGIKSKLISGFRTLQDQQELYANYIAGQQGQPLPFPKRGAVPLAAKPGTSLHERGMAADLQADDPDQQDALIALAKTNPALRTIAGDPNHFELTPGEPVQLAGATPSAGDLPAADASTVAAAPPAPSGQGGIGSDARIALAQPQQDQRQAQQPAPKPQEDPNYPVMTAMQTGTIGAPARYTMANFRQPGGWLDRLFG